jgi:predicted acetyltransferase/predicted nucleotidyltransferase
VNEEDPVLVKDLILRPPREDEKEEFVRAHRMTSLEYPSFLHYYHDAMPFARYLQVLEEQARGIDVPPGRVPTTFLFAFAGPRIVGRVSIRHWLNPSLERTGGHIGYVVVPEFRRRGYATAMLEQALAITRDRLGLRCALVTCDDDNEASRRTIEKCGGVLRDVISAPDLRNPKRRYWIDVPSLAAPADDAARRERSVGRFLAAFTEWAAQRPDITAAALAGSYARDAARHDSDVDLMILTSDPGTYSADTRWLEELGYVGKVRIEPSGKATSVRAWYADSLEVEYTFAGEDWAASPPDKGTRRVLLDGTRVLFERRPVLSRLLMGTGLSA